MQERRLGAQGKDTEPGLGLGLRGGQGPSAVTRGEMVVRD